MKSYDINNIKQVVQEDGDYWIRFSTTSRWMPCVIKSDLCGIEIRISINSAYFGELAYWPEDPEMMHELGEAVQVLGPILQPVTLV